ncbi:MAG TPA: ATP-binding protein [Clostridia bacterium]|jgi:ATP-dependent DNA helicase RecG|nr:AAA family ATPase [Clostridiaceae bacterium]HOF27042.1 ATP-binding protein [Clostridia bacterium]HOM34348.1 ATP-binding protein [Clostridia bacterium]HOR89346.1 ATP-binding protein [Clostridia bacterium]HOT70538.1 ATP-binding protein [Clostridia bacterium]
MEPKESINVEFKQEVSKTFLKTVSAYANYNDGRIIFGIDDNGIITGLDDAEAQLLRIENMINDSVSPIPNFSIQLKSENNKETIVLTVRKGKDTPYFYDNKAYRRADTATVEVDGFELRRLVMQGMNINYESIKAYSQDLSFNTLEEQLKKVLGIEKLSLDILKTLNLYNIDGYYNIAAELLADTNAIKFSGVDIVKFGKDINTFLYRETITEQSLLLQYKRALELYEQYYTYEEIEGFTRVKKELIPKEAFREALANALVHRVWDINSFIQIAMYDDRIEISSPGGLPPGLSENEYLLDRISVLRNPIIADVFNKLDIIEKFGTGITRIKEQYTDSITKPDFCITENRIIIELPVTEKNILRVSEDEKSVYTLLKNEAQLSRNEIDAALGFDKFKTIRVLNNLIDKNIVDKEGKGSAVVYKLK